MSFLFSSRPFSFASGALAVLLAAGCITPSPTSAPVAGTVETDVAIPTDKPPVPLEALPTFAYDGDQQILVTLDREVAAAGTDAAQLDALATRLIGFVRDPAATFAAQQAIAQRLGQFPASALAGEVNGALFSAMLTDEKKVDVARLALEPVPGATVDALFLAALPDSTGLTRRALIQSVGQRRIAAAIPMLAPLLDDRDGPTGAAAARALGDIGTPEAVSALRKAANPSSPVIVAAILEAAERIGGTDGAQIFRTVADTSSVASHHRAAAMRSLLAADPTTAPGRIVRILAGDDPVMKAAVIEAIAAHPAKDLVSVLAADLAKWDAPTQSAVIAALARRGDAAAVGPIAAASEHADASVRAAAISALGFLPGSADTALFLAELAATADTDEAKLARQSLARLDGPSVANAVISGARTGEPAIRAVFLEQIASRYMIESLPLLLATRSDADASIRSAALGALNDIAPARTQKELLAWAVAATDSTEQARALRALATVTLRNSDAAARARPITDAIEKADTRLAIRLLPVLQRIGGVDSAESAARLALRDDPTLANTAATTLSRWNDQTGLLPLVGVAEKAAGESARAAAVQASVRFLERYRELPSADLTGSISRLLAVTSDEPTRARLVFLLGRAKDEAALALAEKLKSEPALAAEAASAHLAISAALAGPPVVKASSSAYQSRFIMDGKTSTQWNTSVEPDRSIEIDFKLPRPIRQITLDQSSRPDNFPEHYELFVTDDPAVPGDVRASGSGEPTKTVIDLPAGTQGRYVILRNTAERTNGWWTISELYVD